MGLANFLDKAALSAAQVLQNYDRHTFEETLLKTTIGIAFDNQCLTCEGKSTLNLLINQLSRIYPNLNIIDLTSVNNSTAEKLRATAERINPAIVINGKSEITACVVIGKTAVSNAKKTFYIGSDGWIAHFSPDEPVRSGATKNVIGAGAAACFGAANVFRYVFEEQLPFGKLDDKFSLSMFNYESRELQNPQISTVDINETVLVGVGAVGNAAVWVLSNMPQLTGNLVLVDNQKVELSNLQRYILTDDDSVDKVKVELAADRFTQSKLKAYPFLDSWETYLQNRNNWHFERIAVAVDSADDRIAIQSSLPQNIINAWTQKEDLGISRHFDFIKEPCLACLYVPDQEKKNFSQEIADAINLSDREEIIGEYLGRKKPLDDQLIKLISEAMSIEIDHLNKFKGLPLEAVYSKGICGGEIIRFSGLSDKALDVDVPAVFQSAFAGIMLASEIIKHAGAFQDLIPGTVTRFNLLRPMSPYSKSEMEKKNHTGNCICGDEIYRQVYSEKYISSG